ncbi:hypothetical protein PIIN_11425 [Serendipita indica DSM 11827]|uniref:Uncharacterized protein n=1 Tax=Serendipita indica (strain DSM 11827) TaxID=1109443 RepID=G4U1K5_SERID|nr:hypothetical protein PIIN_11425 [Serendipita indica DSM 11827]
MDIEGLTNAMWDASQGMSGIS